MYTYLLLVDGPCELIMRVAQPSQAGFIREYKLVVVGDGGKQLYIASENRSR